MVSSRNKGFSTLLAVFSTALFGLGALLSYGLASQFVPPVDGFNFVTYACVFCCALCWLYNTYLSEGGSLAKCSFVEALRFTVQQLVWVGAILMLVIFALKDASASRVLFASVGLGSSLVLLAVNCWLPRFLTRVFYGEPMFFVFYGPSESVKKISEWLIREDLNNLRFCGYFSPSDDGDLGRGLVYRGSEAAICSFLKSNGIDQLYVDRRLFRSDAACSRFVRDCESFGTRVRLYEDVEALGQGRPAELAGPYCFQEDEYDFFLRPSYRIQKRLSDLVISLPSLLVFALLLYPLVYLLGGPGSEGLFVRSGTYRSRGRDHVLRQLGEGTLRSLSRIPFLRAREHLLRNAPLLWDLVLGRLTLVGPYSVHAPRTQAYFSKLHVKPGFLSAIPTEDSEDHESYEGRVAEYTEGWNLGDDMRRVLELILARGGAPTAR